MKPLLSANIRVDHNWATFVAFVRARSRLYRRFFQRPVPHFQPDFKAFSDALSPKTAEKEENLEFSS